MPGLYTKFAHNYRNQNFTYTAFHVHHTKILCSIVLNVYFMPSFNKTVLNQSSCLNVDPENVNNLSLHINEKHTCTHYVYNSIFENISSIVHAGIRAFNI